MVSVSRQIEVLDLRHFGAAALQPLLLEQSKLWERRLVWDYRESIRLLLEYVDSRSLTGYVAMRAGRVQGYTFGVTEANKAVLGDVYAFGEGERAENPVSELLLDHLLETFQATPGIDRVESQLLLFPEGALRRPFLSRGLVSASRLFMVAELETSLDGNGAAPLAALPLESWRPELYASAAALIHASYAGHMDSEINDQYRSLAGAKRFLHNVVNFPGCGVFDPAASWLLRDPKSGEMLGLVLCSRVRVDAAHITQLCVSPSLRGRGFGDALLAHCLAHLVRNGVHTVSLTVTEDNVGARRLYERQGFRARHQFQAWVWNKGRRS